MERLTASDPIVAEVRRDRERLFARFNYDLKAFGAYLAAQAKPQPAGRKRVSKRPRNRAKAR